MPGTGTLLLLAFASLVVFTLLVLLQLTRLGLLVRSAIPDRPRRRMFIASVSFLITFLGVRILVRLIVNGTGSVPVGHGARDAHSPPGVGHSDPAAGGYGWLLDLGRSHSPLSIFMSRLMSVSYGVGAALTLDEFSLWLNLEPDAYWNRSGRLSIDAVVLFGSILAVGAWGAPFFRSLHYLWDERARLGKGLGRGLAFPIRRARLLRRRKVRQSKPA
jgi:hypothetical protein